MSRRLHVRRRGSGAPLVLLHGFTGSAAAWGDLLDRLAERHDVIAFDLPGHGASPSPASAAAGSLPRLADALVRELDGLGIADASWLGYSLGGRVALHVALAHPGRVRALVLEGASPGIADVHERARRRLADERLARSIEGDGLERFVDAWLAQPLFATQARLPAETRARERARRLSGTAEGYAAALRALGVGAQDSLWPRLGALAAPTLLLVGELDVKYRTIAAAMAAALPRARLAVVEGAGHTVHLEQPRAWLAAVARFLARTSSAAAAVAPRTTTTHERESEPWSGSPSVGTPTSCTTSPRASPASPSTGPRCATRSGRRPCSSSPTRFTPRARIPGSA